MSNSSSFLKGLESNATGLQVRLDFASSLHLVKSLLYGIVSIKSIQLIVDYIQSKPPGQKTSMDTFTTILLRNLQLLAIVVALYFIIQDCTLDSGELIASILMWPMFNTPDSFIIVMFAITGFNQLLIFKPHLIEMDFKHWFRCLGVVIFTYAILIDTIMHVNGLRPPVYYGMRHLPNRLESIIVRDIVCGICFVFAVLIRLKMLVGKVADRLTDSKVISDLNIMAMFTFITAVNFAFGLYELEKRGVILEVDGVLLVCCWPIAIILSNDKVSAFVKRRYQNEIEMVVGFSDSVWRYIVYFFTSNNSVHPLIV